MLGITSDWSQYSSQYKSAADLLFNTTLDDGKSNHLVFPLIFLYRHFIELTLKEIMLNGGCFLDASYRLPSGHNIRGLWVQCRELLVKIDLSVNPSLVRNEEYATKVCTLFDSIESDIGKFTKIDPDSEHFRYPMHKDENPMNLGNNLIVETTSGTSSID
jgi:hypothetical protein